MASLSLRHIYKVYPGGVRAVSDFNLDIDDKEFIVFVGPSGCGKSTTLRMIAGLEDISAGELYIDDKLVNDVEPKDRDIAMVFQNYALYPHMTVYDNMAFGLRLRHVPAQVIDEKVQEAAKILGIEALLSRRPKALSGGQRQRVALGRAIVREPKVFLLDEPLSNLDAKLRVQMRTEITKIHHRLATTFIYVTHDQTEAMTMGTRIVVMKDGIVQQVDTPTTLYDNPANLFVACFLGSPQMNIFKAKLIEENGNVYAKIGETNKVLIPKSRAKRIIDMSILDKSSDGGAEVLFGIRPEDVHYEQSLVEAHPESVIEATVDVIENLGNETILYLNVEGKDDYTIARVNSRYSFAQGDVVKMYLATDHTHLFDTQTEMTLMGVPDYNLIPAQTVAIDGTLAVVFGDVCIKLPESVIRRITDNSAVNSKITLGISPKAFFNELPGEQEAANTDAEAAAEQRPERVEYVKIEGKVEFCDNYPRFKAVYAKIPGCENNVIVSVPLDENVSGGEDIVRYIDPREIQLFDADGKRIIADAFVTGNTTSGTVTENQNTVVYKLTGANGSHNKLSFVNIKKTDADSAPVKLCNVKTSEQETPIHIDNKGFSIARHESNADGDIQILPKMVLTGVIKRLDECRRDAFVTVQIPGFDNDVTAVINDFSGYNTGDKIKLAVDPDSVIIGSYEPIKEIIKKGQPQGEIDYKDFLSKREKERAAEKPVKAVKTSEQAATVDTPADEKKPAKKPAAKKPPVKKPIAKNK
ncbi:MAG: sn-glycerol-3-phosphate ABC transporter ATP-binding protein UgpC [Clostridia bacterium]|nr:sn-glycerol-3-phosphate ABC transporter ATP-binding protein UgpC [Clostridia bacterium]MCI9459664.1 sn-glycerol-3-phosphate ABC transporter ATP-binding protein UgpC [Clostridia bacterium]